MLHSASADRGKRNTDVPLVLRRWSSPYKSMGARSRAQVTGDTPRDREAPGGDPV